MFRALAAALLALAVSAPAFADQWADTVKKAQSAVVYIESSEGFCTGFVIDQARKYVLTAAHCDGKDLWVDHVSADVVFRDTKKDLLVLKVENLDPAREALKLAAADPEIRQDVMSVGYGYGLERPFFKTAHVSDTAVMVPQDGIGGPFIGVDASFTPGQSGGPVVNISGEVVAIVQRGDGGTLGIGVGVSIIKETARFWGK